MIEITALVACLVLSGLTVFQIALVLGAPIGHFAWGGAYRVLPGKLRVGSVIAVLLYAVFAVFILDKAGLVDVIADDSVTAVGMWVITGYFTLGILMNGISRSKLERAVMTPTAFVLALSSLVVALN